MLIVIVGPTGSGKTSIALSLAQKYNAPIINGRLNTRQLMTHKGEVVVGHVGRNLLVDEQDFLFCHCSSFRVNGWNSFAKVRFFLHKTE